jgi:predicted nucleotidyltransferase
MHSVTTKEEVLSALKAEMPRLQSEFGITRMALFGSFAVGNPTETSDVDLLSNRPNRLDSSFLSFQSTFQAALEER